MDNNTVAMAALTLAGTIAAGFFTLVNKQNRTHEKIAQAMDKVASSNVAIADETRALRQEAQAGNQASAMRNGHLGEQNVQIAELVADHSNQMLGAIQNIQEQHISKQTIDKQVINK